MILRKQSVKDMGCLSGVCHAGRTVSWTVAVIIMVLSVFVSPLYAFSPKVGYHFRTEDARFDSTARLVLRHEVNRMRDGRAAEWADRLVRIADASHNPVLKSRAAFWSIRANQLSAKPDSCILVLEKVRNALPRSYDYDYACLSYQLAGNHSRMGDYFLTYQ